MIVNEPVSDADLERFLRRRDRLSSAYAALDSEQPSPALDARVLEHARTALEDDGQAASRRHRWTRLTALAATVLLSFALILRLALETGEMPAAPSPPRAPAPESNIARDAAGDRLEAQRPQRAQPTQDLPRAAIEAKIRAASEQPMLATPTSAAAETRVFEREEAKHDRAKSAAVPQEPAPSAAPAPVEEAVATEAHTPPPGDVRAGAVSETQAQPMRGVVATGDRARASTAMKKVESSADDGASAPDPEVWLQEIERLRAAGRIEEADLEMQRFREVYPDYVREGSQDPTR